MLYGIDEAFFLDDRYPRKAGRDRTSTRKLLPYIAGEKRWIILILALGIIAAALTQVPPYITKLIVDSALSAHNEVRLVYLVATMGVVAVLIGGISFLQLTVTTRLISRIVSNIRLQLLRHLCRLPLASFSSARSADISARPLADMDDLGRLLILLFSAFNNGIVIIGAILAMSVMNWRLTIIAVTVLPPLFLALRSQGVSLRAAQGESRLKRDELESFLRQHLSVLGVLLTKTFAQEETLDRKFRALASSVRRTDSTLARTSRMFLATVMGVLMLVPALVWFGAGLLRDPESLGAGTILAFIAYIARLYGPTAAMLNIHLQLSAIDIVCARIFQYLDTSPEVLNDGLELASGDIRFENVSFSYPGRRPALDDISLTIRKGETVAIVGPSGSGKSTIVALLEKLYAPDRGRIVIGPNDIRDVNTLSLRRSIAIVTQDTLLLNASIIDNIRIANEHATREEVLAVCRAAQLGLLLETLPRGLDTLVGEDGIRFSGGERQRIAIARALLRPSAIVILDEATSALDNLTERAIRGALAVRMRSTTNIIISHRLTSVLTVDKIVLVVNGRLEAVGTHESLMKESAIYERLYSAATMH